MRDRWRVAVIDSGLARGALPDGGLADSGLARGALPDGGLADSTLHRGRQCDATGPRAAGARTTVLAARRFVDNGYCISGEPAVSDPIGHGTAVTRLICSSSSTGVEFLIGQVLNEHGVTTPASVAAAICWATESRVDLIHISLGLREDRRVLADAVAGAVAAGCVVIASAPARGSATFPAAYAEVIRATGDARCAEGDVSVLGTAPAHFGGCPRNPAKPNSGGASIGAANVSAIVVARLPPGSDTKSVSAQLTALARYRGAEKRLA